MALIYKTTKTRDSLYAVLNIYPSPTSTQSYATQKIANARLEDFIIHTVQVQGAGKQNCNLTRTMRTLLTTFELHSVEPRVVSTYPNHPKIIVK